MMSKRLIFLWLLCSFIIFSCKKDEPQKSNRDYLVEKACWRIKAFEVKDEVTGVYSDITYSILQQECKRDNCFRFYKDGKYEENEGQTKCKSSDLDIVASGNWSLAADNRTITIITEGKTSEVTISSINGIKLITEGTVNILSGIVPVRITYE